MRVIITGATGFIGYNLTLELLDGKHDVVALTRSINKGKHLFGDRDNLTLAKWDGTSALDWGEHADGADAIVNLAGENVSTGYWTKAKKEKILSSRLDAGRAVVEAISAAGSKPEVLIQGSATGLYGSRGDEPIDESSGPGSGFLAEVTKKWEPSTEEVEEQGVRRAIIRTGVVIDKSGGALSKMSLPYRFFAGGHIGNGDNWFPWIHLADEVRAIVYLLENKDLSGAFNLTAPEPERMKDFSRKLGQAMKRPSWMPVPAFFAKLALGEMADEMFLSSARVLPGRLMEAGFKFQYPDAGSALREVYAVP